MKPSDVHRKLREAEQKALEADLSADSENEAVDESKQHTLKTKDRINTAKVLNSNYFNGEGMGEDYFSSPKSMQVSVMVSDRYDFALTEDVYLLYERKELQSIISDIYEHSPYKGKYITALNIIKVPKDKIFEIFHYIKNELLKRKSVSAMELMIAINEFFEFNYEYVYNKVLTPKMKSDIITDYYKNLGMKDRIDKEAEEPLF